MSITKNGGRQWPLSAYVDFAWDDFTASGTIEAAIDMPAGATVIGGNLVILTAFDSVTSDTLTVGDVGGTENRYADGVDGQAEADTEFTLDNIAYSAATVIGIKWTQVGGSTSAGAGRLRVDYILDDRANEVEPV